MLTLKHVYSQKYENWAYPYLKVKLKVVTPPTSVDDAVRQMKLVLKDEILNHFKTDGKVTGTIRISQELAGFFINHWHFTYNNPVNSAWAIAKPDDFINTYSPVIEEFSKFQIQNPQIILRVLFSCLHEFLNHETFSLSEEVENYKRTNPRWDLYPNEIGGYYESGKNLEAFEKGLLQKMQLELFSVGDTIGCKYYERKRRASFYISAVVLSIDHEYDEVIINIFDIVSHLRYRKVMLESGNVELGVTILPNVMEWYKKNQGEVNYRNGSYEPVLPELDEYLNIKGNVE